MRASPRLIVLAAVLLAGPALACRHIRGPHTHSYPAPHARTYPVPHPHAYPAPHAHSYRGVNVGVDFGPRVGFSVGVVRHVSYAPPPMVVVEQESFSDVPPPMVEAPVPPPPPPAPVVVVQQPPPPPPPPARQEVRQEREPEEREDDDRLPRLALRWSPVGFMGMGAVEPTRLQPVDLLTGIASGSFGAEVRLFNSLFGIRSDFQYGRDGGVWDVASLKFSPFRGAAMRPHIGVGFTALNLVEHLQQEDIARTRTGVVFNAGLSLYFGKHFFLEAEARYRRFGDVDGNSLTQLHQWSALAGVGVAFL